MIDALLTGPLTPPSYIFLPPLLMPWPLAAELEHLTYPSHSSSLSRAPLPLDTRHAALRLPRQVLPPPRSLENASSIRPRFIFTAAFLSLQAYHVGRQHTSATFKQAMAC